MSQDMIGPIDGSLVPPMNDLVAKLMGMDGTTWREALVRFLRKENPWHAFTVWRRVILGAHKTVAGYAAAFEDKGNRMTDWAGQILAKTPVAATREELELVLVTGAQLGFNAATTRAQIYERAAAFGLIPCPAEVGPALREQYQEQPLGEWILVAMEPIEDSDRCPSVFRVGRRDGGRWLSANVGRAGNEWGPGVLWVFLRRKP